MTVGNILISVVLAIVVVKGINLINADTATPTERQPAYQFVHNNEGHVTERCNLYTGRVECFSNWDHTWFIKGSNR